MIEYSHCLSALCSVVRIRPLGLIFISVSTLSIISIFMTVQVYCINPANNQVPTNISDLFYPGFKINNPTLCNKLIMVNSSLLVVVATAPQNAAARKAIRETWGLIRTRHDTALAFFVGSSKQSESVVRNAIEEESKLFSDIIQFKSLDSYNNLILKTLSMMEWTVTYCKGVRFVLKIDDDVFLNTENLYKFIHFNATNYSRSIFGRVVSAWKPIRQKSSKNYVSETVYPAPLFPDFCTGPAYLITGDVLKEIYQDVLHRTFIPLEDVLVTGISAETLKIDRINIEQFLNIRIFFLVNRIQASITIHDVSPSEMLRLHAANNNEDSYLWLNFQIVFVIMSSLMAFCLMLWCCYKFKILTTILKIANNGYVKMDLF